MPKRTYQPKAKRRQMKHGFRKRIQTQKGRLVLKKRRLKLRKRISL